MAARSLRERKWCFGYRTMMTNRLCTAALLFGFLAGVPSSYAEDRAPTAQQIIDAAHLKSDLAGNAPYVLTGRVVVNPGEKNEQTGRVTIYRDRDRSRVDLQLGNYSETRISVGDRRYIPRGKHLLNTMGLPDLDESWDPGRPPRFATDSAYKFGKVKKTTINSRPAWCFDKTRQEGHDRLCFGADSSALISENSGVDDHHEYLDYTSLGQQVFPRLVKIRKQWTFPLEVRDIAVSRESLDDKLFSIPPDTIEVGNCKNIRPPQAVSTPEPDFPVSASRENKQVMLLLSAIVNKEGRVEEIEVLNPGSDGFDAPARDAVRNWKFKPATCGGQPVNMEMSLEISFKRN